MKKGEKLNPTIKAEIERLFYRYGRNLRRISRETGLSVLNIKKFVPEEPEGEWMPLERQEIADMYLTNRLITAEEVAEKFNCGVRKVHLCVAEYKRYLNATKNKLPELQEQKKLSQLGGGVDMTRAP